MRETKGDHQKTKPGPDEEGFGSACFRPLLPSIFIFFLNRPLVSILQHQTTGQTVSQGTQRTQTQTKTKTTQQQRQHGTTQQQRPPPRLLVAPFAITTTPRVRTAKHEGLALYQGLFSLFRAVALPRPSSFPRSMAAQTTPTPSKSSSLATARSSSTDCGR